MFIRLLLLLLIFVACCSFLHQSIAQSFSGTSSQVTIQDSLISLLDVYVEEDSARVAILIELGNSLKNIDPKLGEEYLSQGLVIANRNGFFLQKALIQQAQIQFYALNGKSEKAIITGLSALRVFDSLNMADQILLTQSQLIPIYSAEGYYQQALEMSLNSLSQVEDEPDTPSKGRYYFNVGNSYRHLKDFEKALNYYEQARLLSERTNYRIGVVVISLNMALCKMEQNQLEDAEELIEPEITYLKEVGNASLLASALSYLGDIAAKQANHEAAISYHEQAISYYTQLGFRSAIQDASLKLYVQYSIIGKDDLAAISEKKYKQLRDSLQNEEITKIVGDLQAKYDTEKKEAEIQSLKQASEIQSLRIKQRNLIIIFSLIAFALIVAVIVFLNRQRNAAKRRMQIELEQRFLRSQLNPHFISNALVAVQSSLMEGDAQAAETYLSTFSRLMREILEYSREEYIPIEDEVRMLTDYLEINRKRLKGQIDYSITVDEEIDDSFDQVPPMLIQPFIENAIDHGIPPEGEKMEIKVVFKRRKDCIEVSIVDNGGGIKENISADKRSLSTQIIKERITLLNESLQKEIVLRLDNYKNVSGATGLKVMLSLPLL
ncbi:MAG: histidine kinase [Ekhidna sp.]|nr:histidine kinase [Ekhidna sp.]